MKAILILLSIVIASVASCKQKQEGNTSSTSKDSAAVTNTVSITRPDTAIPLNGIYEKKHSNGQLSMRGEMRNGKREGLWRTYYENGQPWSEGEYKDGLRHGKTITWFENGQKRYEGAYTNGKESGKWKFWTQEGKLEKEMDYDAPASK